MRTIAARIRNTSTELDDLGESMTSAEYDELVQSLTDYNVALTDSNGEFRSTYEIMEDIAGIWDDLASMEQAALAETLSGTRQQNVFYSLIEQFQEASEAMDAMDDSTGALSDSYDIYLESTTAHIQTFKAAVEELGSDLFPADFLNFWVDMGTNIINTIDKIANFIDSFGGLNTVLGITIGLMTTFAASSFAASITNMIKKVISLGTAFKSMYTGITAATSATELLTGSLSAVLMVVGVLVTAFSALYAGWQAYTNSNTKSTDELASEYNEITTEIEELNSELDEAQTRIEELESQDSLTLVEQSELETLRQTNELLEEQIALKEQLATDTANEYNDSLTNDFLNQEYSWLGVTTLSDEEINKYTKAVQNNLAATNAALASVGEEQIKTTVTTEEYTDTLLGLYQTLSSEGDDLTDSQSEQMATVRERLQELYDSYVTYLTDFNLEEADAEGLLQYTEILESANALYALLDPLTYCTEQLEEMTDVYDVLSEQAQNGTLDAEWIENYALGCDELQALMDETGVTAAQLAEHFIALAESGELVEESVENVSESLLDSRQGYDDLVDSVDNAESAISTMNEVIADNTCLTEDEYEVLTTLAGSEDALADCIDTTNGYLVTNADALKEVVDASLDALEANLDLAVSHERFNYHELVSQLYDAVDGLTEYDDAAQANVDSILEQIDAVQDEIAAYALLEQQLLGTTNAFNEIEDAQDVDSATDYSGNLVDMIEGLYEGFETGRVGTEAFGVAWDSLIPDEVLDGIYEDADKVDAAYDYLQSKLKRYYTIDEDSGDVSIELDNMETFLNDALNTVYEDSTVFIEKMNDEGQIEYDVNPAITSLDEFADAMGITETVAFALLDELSNYDLGGDSLFTQFLTDTNDLDTAIYNCDTKMQELVEKQAQLLKDGQYGSEEWYENQAAIDACKTSMEEYQAQAKQSVLDNADLNSQIEAKNEEVIAAADRLTEAQETYAEALEAYNKNENPMTERALAAAESGLKAAEQNAQELEDEYYALIEKKYQLEEPTELTIQIAMEDIQSEIDDLTSQLDELATYDTELEVWVAVNADDQDTVDQLAADLAEAEANLDTVTAYAELDDEDITEALAVIDEYEFEDKSFKVILENYETIKSELLNVSSLINKIDGTTATTTVIQKYVTSGSLSSSTASIKSSASFQGNANATGTAHESGQWGTEKAEHKALVGELGPELYVSPSTGMYYTVGEHGAEMIDLPKGAIIFNHRQTEELLKYGNIDSRGRALATGNAHSYTLQKKTYTGTGKYGTSSNSSKSSSSGSSTTTTTVSTSTDVEDELEDQLEELQEALEEILGDFEHNIYMLERNGGTTDEIVAQYRAMQEQVSAYADKYRALGLDETSDYIQDLEEEWWEYEDSIREVMVQAYEDAIAEQENSATLIENWMNNAINAGSLTQAASYAAEIADCYSDMMATLHEEAEYYRSLGYSDTSDEVSALSDLWWDYYNEVIEYITSIYDAALGQQENLITLTENWFDNAVANGDVSSMEQYANQMISYYQQMQETLHEQAEYYRSLGYSDTSDEVSELSDLWWEYADAIEEIKESVIDNLQEIVDAANEMVDDIQDVYDTLHDAADEYAASGYITVDTLQSIIELGAEYLAYLVDENGQLVINEENIQKVIAARTEQLALESAMTYVEQLRIALQENDTESLNELLYATTEATDATWGLVYAQLAMLNLSDDEYSAALNVVNALRTLASSAVTSIGQETTSVEEELSDMYDGVESIIDYVMDMLEDRIDQQIDALEDMKDAYSELISLRKKALEAAKDEADYEDEVADKVKQIAKLQEQINALSLDDSREAQAQKAALEEELAELQKELADYQADYAIEAQEDALDEMESAYEDEKDAEIAALEESISSYEKLYSMAIAYIEENWGTLYSELISWNTEYGSVLNDEIMSAWEQCLLAAERYGSFVEAMNALPSDIDAASGDSGSSNTVVGETYTGSAETESSTSQMIQAAVTQMQSNAAAWHSASDSQREAMSQENEDLATLLASYGVNVVKGADGTWYLGAVGQSKLFDVYGGLSSSQIEAIQDIVDQMEANSKAWHSADALTQSSLATENEQLAASLSAYGISAIKGSDGVWYIGSTSGTPLFDAFHTGGIVGREGSLKQNEVMAVLEKGEAVLDEQKEEGLYKLIDFIDVLSEKLNTVIDRDALSNLASSTPTIQTPLPEVSASDIENITNNQTGDIRFGDIYIYGADSSTVQQHQEVNRKFVNQVIDLLGIKK